MRHVPPSHAVPSQNSLRQEKLSLPGMRKSGAADHNGTLESTSLFKGSREVRIRHNDETYRLTITKLGKLILTK
ncbi:Hemin uptake protein [Pannonibacter phragmitetus]|uniref:Hemin uptake protein n=1 Tax=Pannonibacter phragmitetus TaxID=121719 RepID=A0A378ZSE7_9HYPH|nr:hemin uptake protein HemP [Pannonibacter phragmitetus]SUA99710.1 Hemin uptake protein [Pannonibacter phragmitetus]